MVVFCCSWIFCCLHTNSRLWTLKRQSHEQHYKNSLPWEYVSCCLTYDGVIRVQKGHVDVVVTSFALFVCKGLVLWCVFTLLTSFYVSKVHVVTASSWLCLCWRVSVGWPWSCDFFQVFVYGDNFQIQKLCESLSLNYFSTSLMCQTLWKSHGNILSKAERFRDLRSTVRLSYFAISLQHSWLSYH